MSEQQPERPTCATCPCYVRRKDDGGRPQTGECRLNPHPEPTHDNRWCSQHPDFQAWLAATRKPQ